MNHDLINQYRLDIAVKAKHGIDFIASATIIWIAITFVWTLPYSAYDRSVLSFIAGGPMIPLALLFSRIFKTRWNNPENPIASLGVWLNVAQLFYFPILVFMLIKFPDHFIMTYVIITGAHFFPYGWFYKEPAFSIMAAVIALGGMFLGLTVSTEQLFLIPLAMTIILAILLVWIYLSFKQKEGLLNTASESL
ncbi:MAG: hypothetical protein AAFY71_25520 [Bacteroidota bacterium]